MAGTDDVTQPAPVQARTMTLDEFAVWRSGSITAYAADRALARGTDVADELPVAERSLDEYLPHGLDTPGTAVLTVLGPDGERVGSLWLGPHPNQDGAWWVYDIVIDETSRGQGLGRATMQLAEQVSREAGATGLGLNVFGFNTRARALYDSLGYRVVSTQMIKEFDG